MTKWINDKGEEYNGRYVVEGDRKYLSPSEKKLAELGYTKVVTPSPKVDNTQAEIWSLKEQLQESDYKAIKYAEGWIGEEDYAPIKAERQALRDRINELERSGEND